jgi:hypothetical protein
VSTEGPGEEATPEVEARRAGRRLPPSGGGELRYTRPLRYGPPYDPARRREETRSRLALALVTLISLIALLLVVLTALEELTIDDAKDLAGVVLAPLIAVTGTVFGFYYGGHT